MRSVLAAVAALAVVGCDGSGAGVGDGDGGTSDDGGGGSDDDGGGGGPHARDVTLTLTNRPTTGATFSFLVAYQDGSAAWQLAPAPAGDVYTLPIYAPTYGVAFACIGANAGSATQVRSVTTAFFAVGERDALTLDVPARCSDRAAQTVTLSGNVQNRPFGGVLTVQFGGKTATAGSQSGNFSLAAPAGTHDLTVTHAVPQGNGDFYVDAVWLQRNVTLTAATARTINFADADATDTYDIDLGLGPIPIDVRGNVSTTLYTANGSTLGLARLAQNVHARALDASQRLASDVYDQSVTLVRTGSSATVTTATNTPADIDFMAPAPLGQLQTTVPTKMPYVTLETSWLAYPNAIGYQWNATQQPASCGNTPCTIVWTAYVSPGVVGTMPAFRMPDLHDLTGWKSAFELVSSTPVVGGVTALTSSAGATDFPTVTPPANSTTRTFVRTDFAVTP